MKKPKSVLFVCHGNIIRSPLAEALFRTLSKEANLQEDIHADSAGMIAYHCGEHPDSRMLRTARARGFEYDHIARQIEVRDLERFDLIMVMDGENYADVLDMSTSSEQEQKIHFLREFDADAPARAAVPDPYFGGPDGFERTYEIVERAARGLVQALLEGKI